MFLFNKLISLVLEQSYKILMLYDIKFNKRFLIFILTKFLFDIITVKLYCNLKS